MKKGVNPYEKHSRESLEKMLADDRTAIRAFYQELFRLNSLPEGVFNWGEQDAILFAQAIVKKVKGNDLELFKECVEVIEGLAGQQAMPDYGYVSILEKIKDHLKDA